MTLALTITVEADLFPLAGVAYFFNGACMLNIDESLCVVRIVCHPYFYILQ